MCNKKSKMNDYGYSLVELIVTIVIIAVLASATAIAVVKYVRKSKVSADIEVAGELKSAAYNVSTDAVAKYGSIASCTFVFATETMTLTSATDLSQSTNEEALVKLSFLFINSGYCLKLIQSKLTLLNSDFYSL